MKRDHRLRDLSDDHHQALVLAQRATQAAAGEGAAPVDVWDELLRRFEDALAPHFAIEEEYLLPALDQAGHTALARRTRDEHAALRQLVGDDARDVQDKLAAFGTLMRDHVRFEERELFMAIQETVADDVLEAVAAACRSARAQRG